MNCCKNCFQDSDVKKYILKNGKIKDCDFCGSKSVPCVEPHDLRQMLNPIISLYISVENFMSTDELKEFEGDMLWEILNRDWYLFNIFDNTMIESLTAQIVNTKSYKEDYPLILTSYVVKKEDYYNDENHPSEIMENKWEIFTDSIKTINRFFLQKEFNHSLLRRMIGICKKTIHKDTVLYRCRISPNKETFSSSEMGRPPCEKATPGRANPRGISYLYLALEEETAISEVRPYIGDLISVATFRLTKDLKIIDLENIVIKRPVKYGHNLSEVIKYLDFLRKLGEFLEKPINPLRTEIDYLPTQYLCEYIKHLGYDGVRYRSSLNKGSNFVFFFDEAFEVSTIVSNYTIKEMTFPNYEYEHLK